jgi:imidazole glycerol-phosphate synthase subunit HisF
VEALMLKKRIIPVQLLLGERLVKTTGFNHWRDVGDPVASSRVYNSQYADELIFLNISRDSRSIAPLLQVIEKVSSVCFMPLSLGGGVNSLADATALIKQGADKVILNSAVYRDYSLISRIADTFGSQAAIVSIDVKRMDSGNFSLFSHCGRVEEKMGLPEHIEKVVAAGAGEIFVNSINNDGAMQGYDIALIREVVDLAKIPVIGCGGAGNFSHMKEAFLSSGASALACGSLFNFGDNNPIRAKAFLTNHGLPFKKV